MFAILREREFILHIAKTREQVHNRNAKLEGLPERHLAHQSWPPEVDAVFNREPVKLLEESTWTA